MNALFAALFFLMIGGAWMDAAKDQKALEVINKFRELYGKEKGLTMKPVTLNPKLNEMGRKFCNECTPKNEIKPESGYQIHAVLIGGDPKKFFEEVFTNPETTEIGGCEHEKCKSVGYNQIFVMNSATFLNFFLMIALVLWI